MARTILTQTQFETRVADVFSIIRTCRMTSTEANKRVEEQIYAESNRQYANGRYVYSTFERGFVMGLVRAANTALWKEVEFCYIVDGVIFSTHKQSVHRKTEEFYAKEQGHLLSDAPGGHFWLGTDKPFTEPKKSSDLGPKKVFPEIGYLQHGSGTQGPFRTESVKVKTEDSGNTWKCRFEGKWRSVRFQGNDTFIIFQGERIQIQIEGVGKW